MVAIARWHVDLCQGSHCAAAIVGYLQLIREGALPHRKLHTIKTICDGLICLFSRDSVIKALDLLLDAGLLIERTFDRFESQEKCAQKEPQNGFGDCRCEWCKGKTCILEEHHYPIPRSEGGAEIVQICGSCHREFHFLTSNRFFEWSEVLLQLFEENPLPEGILLSQTQADNPKRSDRGGENEG